MTIGVGTRHVQEFISGQSVMFVAIAFITMMIISLAWLIFYYIQRFLYTSSQFGSQSHRKETKKVIGQPPLHTIKHKEKKWAGATFSTEDPSPNALATDSSMDRTFSQRTFF